MVTEFPSNPLLKSPPLTHLRRLADTYDFLIIVDETVGNIFNVCVIPYADIVVSSLTKIFSGESNVMGGSLVLNPSSRHYLTLKTLVTTICEDNTWCEDLVFLERNSRNFVERIKKINQNTEFVADLLKAHPYGESFKLLFFSINSYFSDMCMFPNYFHSQASLLPKVHHPRQLQNPSKASRRIRRSPLSHLPQYLRLCIIL